MLQLQHQKLFWFSALVIFVFLSTLAFSANESYILKSELTKELSRVTSRFQRLEQTMQRMEQSVKENTNNNGVVGQQTSFSEGASDLHWLRNAMKIPVVVWVSPLTDSLAWPEQYDPTFHRIPTRKCGNFCKFVSEEKDRATADLILENSDPKNCLPPKSNISSSLAIYVGEALDLEVMQKQRKGCPTLSKVDYYLSFHVEESNTVVPCGTLFSADDVLEKAQNSLRQWPLSSRENAIGFVSRNSREFRNEMAKKLQKAITLNSYGSVLNNHPWPDGKSNDKLNALKRNRFCLAVENHLDDPEYITEKLWDCYKSASIPIYYGNLGKAVVPPNSYINVTYFDSIEDLGQFLAALTEEDLAPYLDWVTNPPIEFLQFWKKRAYNDVLCRLCERVQINKYLANKD